MFLHLCAPSAPSPPFNLMRKSPSKYSHVPSAFARALQPQWHSTSPTTLLFHFFRWLVFSSHLLSSFPLALLLEWGGRVSYHPILVGRFLSADASTTTFLLACRRPPCHLPLPSIVFPFHRLYETTQSLLAAVCGHFPRVAITVVLPYLSHWFSYVSLFFFCSNRLHPYGALHINFFLLSSNSTTGLLRFTVDTIAVLRNCPTWAKETTKETGALFVQILSAKVQNSFNLKFLKLNYCFFIYLRFADFRRLIYDF